MPGSSRAFWASLVTYANEAKAGLLGVDATIIERNGAVSEECVKAMIEGLARNTQASLFVAISGVAGPDGGTPEKPVGTVWIAVGQRGGPTDAVRLSVTGNRGRVRRVATLEALILVRRRISAA